MGRLSACPALQIATMGVGETPSRGTMGLARPQTRRCPQLQLAGYTLNPSLQEASIIFKIIIYT